MFCSSVRDDVAATVVESVVEDALAVAEALVVVVEEEDWRLDLAWSSSFSWSRSFWICFCSSSERLKNLRPPVSSFRDCFFFRISCFSRSISVLSLSLSR